MKLQDAYISEVGTGIGDWKLIGYKMKSTSNFQYFEGTTENGETAGQTVLLKTGKTAGWKAVNVGALNDCVANSVWQLNVEANTASGGSADYSAIITGGPGGDCYVLTPNFEKLDTKDGVVANAT